jgi:hypothetical protein
MLQKHIQSHIPNNSKVINKNKMSCNTLCPCISSVGEQYSRILHNKIKRPGRLEKTNLVENLKEIN